MVAAVLYVGCSPLSGPDESSAGGCPDGTECRGTPFRVPGVPAFSDLDAGTWHTCGIASDGAAWCWGLGSAAARVPGAEPFVRIGAGRFHTCALTVAGTAYCWSSDGNPALLCGETECGATPVAVGPRVFRSIAVGAQHTCALDPSGAAWCWGFNWMGETGSTRYGQTEQAPVKVPGGLAFTTIRANHGYTCALTNEGAAWCWGWGEVGQLGLDLADLPVCMSGPAGTPVYCSAQPRAVASTDRLVELSAGFTHACALTEHQRMICWGDNGQGQLGDESWGIRFRPGATTNLTWSGVEAGGPITCGTAAAGGTYCWGLNQAGMHGTGTRAEISVTPQRVAGGHSFTVLSAGSTHVCGLTAAGLAYCWGDNSALQLGGR